MSGASEPSSDAPLPPEETGRPRRGLAPGAWFAIIAVLSAVAVAIALVLVQPWADRGETPGGDPTAGAPSSAPPDPSPSAPVDPEEVPFDEEAPIAEGVTVSLSPFEAVDGIAEGPGEVSGPSLRFTVTIRNTTGAEVDLSSTVVTADYGDERVPALQLFAPGGRNLPASVAAGASAEGVYIFSIPVDERGVVRVTVDYSVGVAPVVFTGSAS